MVEHIDRLTDTMSPSERANAERHLSECASCRRRLVALQDVSLPEPASIPPALLAAARRLGRRERAPRIRAWTMGMAAMLAIAFAGLYLYRSPRAVDDTLRDVNRDVEASVTAPRLLVPQDGAVLSVKAAELRWEPAPGVMRYEVRVINERGDVVVERSTTSAAVTLADARDLLRRGERYYWLVRARWPDGRVAESGLRSFVAAE